MSARRFTDEELERFCRFYARTGNGSAAVRHAFASARGLDSTRASAKAWKLLRRPGVQARVAELRAELGEDGASPPPLVRTSAGEVAVVLQRADLEIIARAAAAPGTDCELRLACARLVAQVIGQMSRTAINPTEENTI